MPWGLWLSACYVTPSLTWIGWSLVLRALDYIIQLQNKDFHVYFRENPLFISLYGSLVLLLRYFRVNEQNVVKMSRCDVLPLAESCSQKMPSWQNASQQLCKRKTLVFLSFFSSFLSLHARRHIEGRCSPPEGPMRAGKVQTGQQMHDHCKGQQKPASVLP